MKQIATIFFAFFITAISAQEVAFEQFYKTNKAKSTFSINLSASMAGSFLDDEDELMNIVKKSDDFKLMIFDNGDNGVSNDFKKFSRKNKLKTLARVKEKGSNAELFFIEKNNYIREIIIRANSDENKLVLFGLNTKITKDELAAMISASDVNISRD